MFVSENMEIGIGSRSEILMPSITLKIFFTYFHCLLVHCVANQTRVVLARAYLLTSRCKVTRGLR
jgi:hypothetical protein